MTTTLFHTEKSTLQDINILHIIEHACPETTFCFLSRSLARSEWSKSIKDFIILPKKSHDINLEPNKQCHVSIALITSGNPLINYFATKKIEKIISNNAIQMIHAQGTTVFKKGAQLSRKFNIPLVLSFYPIAPEVELTKKTVRQYMESASTIIVPFQATASLLQQICNVSPEKIQIISPEIDKRKFRNKPVSQQRIIGMAEKLSILDDTRRAILCTLSQTKWKKKLLTLMETVSILKKNSSMEFFIILLMTEKRQEIYDEMHSIISKNKLDDIFYVTEDISDILSVYKLASCVLVMDCAPQTAYVKPFIAQNMNKPLIAAKCHPAQCILKSLDQTCWLYEEDNVYELADAMYAFLSAHSDEKDEPS